MKVLSTATIEIPNFNHSSDVASYHAGTGLQKWRREEVYIASLAVFNIPNGSQEENLGVGLVTMLELIENQ